MAQKYLYKPGENTQKPMVADGSWSLIKRVAMVGVLWFYSSTSTKNLNRWAPSKSEAPKDYVKHPQFRAAKQRFSEWNLCEIWHEDFCVTLRYGHDRWAGTEPVHHNEVKVEAAMWALEAMGVYAKTGLMLELFPSWKVLVEHIHGCRFGLSDGHT